MLHFCSSAARSFRSQAGISPVARQLARVISTCAVSERQSADVEHAVNNQNGISWVELPGALAGQHVLRNPHCGGVSACDGSDYRRHRRVVTRRYPPLSYDYARTAVHAAAGPEHFIMRSGSHDGAAVSSKRMTAIAPNARTSQSTLTACRRRCDPARAIQ